MKKHVNLVALITWHRLGPIHPGKHLSWVSLLQSSSCFVFNPVSAPQGTEQIRPSVPSGSRWGSSSGVISSYQEGGWFYSSFGADKCFLHLNTLSRGELCKLNRCSHVSHSKPCFSHCMCVSPASLLSIHPLSSCLTICQYPTIS